LEAKTCNSLEKKYCYEEFKSHIWKLKHIYIIGDRRDYYEFKSHIWKLKPYTREDLLTPEDDLNPIFGS